MLMMSVKPEGAPEPEEEDEEGREEESLAMYIAQVLTRPVAGLAGTPSHSPSSLLLLPLTCE